MDVTRTALTLFLTFAILLFLGLLVFDFRSWPLWVVLLVGAAGAALAAWILDRVEAAAIVAARERAERRAMRAAAHAEKLRREGLA